MLTWIKLSEGGEFSQTPVYRFTITPVDNAENLLSVLVEDNEKTVTRFTGWPMGYMKKQCETFWKRVQHEIQK